ncbi:MAG: outer membrane protein transport protein, partial [Deltaproteobacteria bacterium]|nr:outer membrane protein transport protein [Deltaproteobacteria bacterium]
PLPQLSFGASLQWVYAKSEFSQVIDGYWQDAPPEEDNRFDVFMDIKVKDTFNFTGIIGMLYQPSERLEIGLAVRPIPVKLKKTGNFEFEYLGAMIKNLYEKGNITMTDTGTTFEAALPVMARVGARYIYKRGEDEIFDVEIDFIYEWWSILEKYHLEFDGGVKLYDGNPNPLPSVDIPKKWKDTVSVRLGGDCTVIRNYLKLRAGGFYESAASPNSTTNIDFLSLDRFGIAFGLTFTYHAFDLSLAYMHIFQLDRTVKPGESEIFSQRPINPSPIGTEVGAGKFSSGFDIFSAGLSVNFDKIF